MRHKRYAPIPGSDKEYLLIKLTPARLRELKRLRRQIQSLPLRGEEWRDFVEQAQDPSEDLMTPEEVWGWIAEVIFEGLKDPDHVDPSVVEEALEDAISFEEHRLN